MPFQDQLQHIMRNSQGKIRKSNDTPPKNSKMGALAIAITCFSLHNTAASDTDKSTILGMSAFALSMKKTDAATALKSRGLPVTLDNEGNIASRFLPKDSPHELLVSATFQKNDDRLTAVQFTSSALPATAQYSRWMEGLLGKYGRARARQSLELEVKDIFCHGRFVEIHLGLTKESLKEYAYVRFIHSPQGSTLCANEQTEPLFEPAFYLVPRVTTALLDPAPAPLQTGVAPQQRYEQLQRCMLVSAILLQSSSWPEDRKAELRKNQKRLMDQAWDAGKAVGRDSSGVLEDAKGRYAGFDQNNKEAFRNEVMFCYSSGILP